MLVYKQDGITIQKAKSAEYADVVALVREAYTHIEPFLGEPYITLGNVRERNEKGFDLYVCRNLEGELIGSFHLLKEREENVLFMGRLAIKKSEQGQGLGKKIVSIIIDYAKKIGAQQVQLYFLEQDSWLESYYQGQGFRSTNVPLPWRGITAYEMRYTIAD